MRRALWHGLCVALLCGAWASAADAPNSAEKKVLDRMLGTWRVEATIFQTEWSPETKQVAGRDVITRVLGGHFVQDQRVEPPGEYLSLNTYDPQRKAYRAWLFHRSGESTQFTGTWDGQTQTLAWTAPVGEGRSVTIRSRFVSDDRTDGGVVTKDDAGKVYFRMEGKSTRVTEPPEPEKKADAPASDQARWQGTWIGQVGDNPERQFGLTVRGDRIDLQGANGESAKGKLVLSPAASPKQVDILLQECSEAKLVGQKMLGIYKFGEDGTLTLAAGEPGDAARPKAFETGPDRIGVVVFRKVRPEKLGAMPSPLDDPSARSAEQKVLDRMLGTWRSDATTFKSEWNSETTQRTSRFACARVLGGHFVQEIHEDAENTHLMFYTYDLQRKGYRAWSFNVWGMTIDLEGKWDAEARSLTWTAPPREGKTLTVQSHYLTDDTVEQSILVKDDAGKIYLRMEAKHTRVKESKE